MRERSVAQKILRTTAIVLAVVSLAALASGSLFRTYRNTTGAMEPTLPVGAHIVATSTRTPTRKDIVTFRYPADTRRVFVKRVVAVGGDTVELREKRLFLNGQEIAERYVIHEDPETYPANASLPDPIVCGTTLGHIAYRQHTSS